MQAVPSLSIEQRKSNKKSKRANKRSPGRTQSVALPLNVSVRYGRGTARPYVVSNKELVGTVAATSTGFHLIGESAKDPGYNLNPGNGMLFPWLSTAAISYEKYRFTKLKFLLVSNSAATVSGRAYMAFDYDVDDEVPSGLAQLGIYDNMVSDNVWKTLTLSVNITRLNSDQKWRFTSPHAALNAIEPRTAYGGFLIVATQGCPANTAFDLYVDYDVEFMCPQASTSFVTSTSGTVPMPFDIGNERYLVTSPVTTGQKNLPWVRCGQNAPVMTTLCTDVPKVADMAIDMAGVGAKSTFTWTQKIDSNSGTPAYVAPGLAQVVEFFDAMGARLGNSDITALHDYRTVFGPAASNAFSIPGMLLRAVMSFPWAAITSVFPSARYMVPLVANIGAAKTAEVLNTGAASFRIEL